MSEKKKTDEEKFLELLEEFNEKCRLVSISLMGAHTFEFDKNKLMIARDKLSFNARELIWLLNKAIKDKSK